MSSVAGFVAWPSAGSTLTREDVGAVADSSGEAKHAVNELLKGCTQQSTITVDPNEGRIELDRCQAVFNMKARLKLDGVHSWFALCPAVLDG